MRWRKLQRGLNDRVGIRRRDGNAFASISCGHEQRESRLNSLEMVMTSIRQESDNRWNVIDDNDKIVFCGSLAECEDWLDHAENLSPSAEASRGGVFRFVRNLFGRKQPEDRLETDDPAPSDAEKSA